MPKTIERLSSRLTFRQLQVFMAVYQLKSYSRAGEMLGLTQPAVSAQIRQLEQAIEQPVFEYVGRRLFATAAGERLAIGADVMFEEMRALQDELHLLGNQVAGQLSITAVNTAQCVLPYLLEPFLKLHPNVKVSIGVANRSAAIERLKSNSSQLIIMGMVPSERALASLPFLDNELIPLVNATHPLRDEQNLDMKDFIKAGLLVREPGSGTRLALETWCQQERVRMKPKMQIDSNDGIKHAAIAGLGVAVLPKLSVRAELQTGVLKQLDIPGFPLRRSWCLVYPNGKHLSPAMQAFRRFVQDHIRDLANWIEAAHTGQTSDTHGD